jgi:exosortase F-associated protein
VSEWTNFWGSPRRVVCSGLALAGLGVVFLFQEVDVVHSVFHFQAHPYIHFAAKKTVRLVMNDSLMLLFIYAWFNETKVTQTAWRLQLVDTFFLLPLYLVLKLSLEGDSELSSPLLSQLHRLIVNPTIMILLIPAVYYQRIRRNKS